ncbi:MAG: tetratricopeptide repeat protein, partial [Nitrososphaera sp.]|nr:tetratricopeptide repeat protein [Nitrososphaera sp.]
MQGQNKVFAKTFGMFANLIIIQISMVLAQYPTDLSKAHQDTLTLQLGKPVERELKGGEVHTYQTTITVGQYLYATVEQRGIDVVVTLFAPDGKRLTEVDNQKGTQRSESVTAIADISGSYHLEVRSLEKERVSGLYAVQIDDLRQATLQDKNRVAAERAFAEGLQLYLEGTAESLSKALKKNEEALSLWQVVEDRNRIAHALNAMGQIYLSLRENRKALEYCTQALPHMRACEDRPGEASTLNNIGAVYKNTGKMQNAIEFYKLALSVWQSLEDHSGEAATLNNLGTVYNDLGEIRRALDYYRQVLPLVRNMGDLRGEAITLNKIGSAHLSLGEYQKALDYHDKSLQLRRTIGDRRGEA